MIRKENSGKGNAARRPSARPADRPAQGSRPARSAAGKPFARPAQGSAEKRERPQERARKAFGNKRSLFLSQEKRQALETEARQAETAAQDKQQQRHSQYEGRYEDRMRSAENLVKKRMERQARAQERSKDRPRDQSQSSPGDDRPFKPYAPRPAFGRPKNAPNSAKKEAEEGMRLNKFIAHSGVCSRRDADMYIASGSVQVNGQTITEMGYKVKPTDRVCFDGVELKAEKKVYVLLNKPKNYITTTDDPDHRHTVMELVKNAAKERLYPVGRLDRTTMGLLLFTNDGELARGVMHPSSNIKKTYHVVLDKTLTANDMGAVRGGLELEDGPVTVDSISYIPDAPHKEVGVEIHTGRNRIVRRIFEHLGYQVVKLDRVQLGPLTKKNLARGQWRHLTAQEVSLLKMIASGKKQPPADENYGLE